jgi:hypothetical protein
MLKRLAPIFLLTGLLGMATHHCTDRTKGVGRIPRHYVGVPPR